MTSGSFDLWLAMASWWQGLDVRAIGLWIAEKLFEGLLQAIAVVVIGWLVVYRQWRQLTQGRSDQVVFSANLLTPLDGDGDGDGDNPGAGGRYVLQLRTVLPPRTIDQLLDNVALRRVMRGLAEQATITEPILATEGTAGFEIVNDVVNNVAGSLASSPFPREPWLLAITCEDRKVVRKCCIRVLLVRREDLERLASWDWCRDHILVEEWYHLWRVVTLHQIALRYRNEQAAIDQARGADIQANLLPLVDSQAHHPRVRALSLGISTREPSIKPPRAVDWERYLPQVAALGLKLAGKAGG
ncbi:MAG: hypothetical protein ACYC61_07255 [Isosphaeraceae bacterium]